MFPKPNSWPGTEKLNLTQQKHTFTNQKKCTTTQNKHKKLKLGLIASYNIQQNKWHQFVRNEVRRLTKQPNDTAIIQSRHLSTAHMDEDADAKMILTAPPPENRKRPPGRPRITWLTAAAATTTTTSV